jgi:hypothetical protein
MYYRQISTAQRSIAKALCKTVNDIYESASNHKILDFNYLEFEELLEPINNFFDTESRESFFMAAFIYQKFTVDEGMNIKYFLEWLKAKINVAPEIQEILDSLYRKRLIKKESTNWEKKEHKYYLSDAAYQAVVSGNKSDFNSQSKVQNFMDIMQNIYSLFQELKNEKIDLIDFQSELSEIISKYSKFKQMKWLKKLRLEEDDQIFLLTVLSLSLTNSDNKVNVEKIVHIIDTKNFRTLRSIMEGKHPLLRKGLIEFDPNEFKSCQDMRLTTDTLVNIDCQSKDSGFDRNQLIYGTLTLPDEIITIDIFLNPEESEMMNSIEQIIEKVFLSNCTKDELTKKFEALKVLTEGPSGVGKTQSILNLAKKYNLIVYEVRGSQMKDMWVGSTEKAYEGVFNEFRKVQKYYKKQNQLAIFVINELEGVLSTRLKSESSINFMVSSATSIFLKEMEKFKGIMITTCNHSKGFIDEAAFRRFNFKIYFKEPLVETRIKIFNNKLPDLSREFVIKICNQYKLKGGQIENICERYMLKKLIGGYYDTEKTIHMLCQSEVGISNSNDYKIGFLI